MAPEQLTFQNSALILVRPLERDGWIAGCLPTYLAT